jgi:hypothetical protein
MRSDSRGRACFDSPGGSLRSKWRHSVGVVESSGRMTKDLAILIGPDHPFLTTDEFMSAIDAELKRHMH